jgi:hypothetical protein
MEQEHGLIQAVTEAGEQQVKVVTFTNGDEAAAALGSSCGWRAISPITAILKTLLGIMAQLANTIAAPLLNQKQ